MAMFSIPFFRPEQPLHRKISVADIGVLLLIGAGLYLGAKLAFSAPIIVKGPVISLSPKVLPWYALFSVTRMGIAYVLSVFFTLGYGYLAARSRWGERLLIPLLDVLQSVPILSFLPLVLLSLIAVLPARLAVEMAAIILIFTSQVWNLTFAWYQSLKSVPNELTEATQIFRFTKWRRFRVLEFPFFAISFIWNSMMSWSGGWFFLMAAETFTVGHKDFRLPGLGSYLKEAAIQHNGVAIAWGLATLVFIIVFMDQIVWRPLIQWSDRFKLDLVESEGESRSWMMGVLTRSQLLHWFHHKLWRPMMNRLDRPNSRERMQPSATMLKLWRYAAWMMGVVGGIVVVYIAVRAAQLMMTVPWTSWQTILLGLVATFGRVVAALLIALAWTVPVGILIGTNKRLAHFLQPIVQIAASIPATALFPLLLLIFLNLPGGLNIAAIFLMVMGTQWYLLFNVIAGANSIPQDLKYTSALLQLSVVQRWRVLILPSLFPFIVTGAIAATGGAWNASIVAEYVDFGGQIFQTHGIGYTIAHATGKGDYALVLSATFVMVLSVVAINRMVWRRLYMLAQERYKME